MGLFLQCMKWWIGEAYFIHHYEDYILQICRYRLQSWAIIELTKIIRNSLLPILVGISSNSRGYHSVQKEDNIHESPLPFYFRFLNKRYLHHEEGNLTNVFKPLRFMRYVHFCTISEYMLNRVVIKMFVVILKCRKTDWCDFVIFHYFPYMR